MPPDAVTPQTGNARSATRPPRKRARRGKKAKVARAVNRAIETRDEIQVTARRRQAERAGGQANVAASRDTDLEDLYGGFRDDKKAIFDAGVPRPHLASPPETMREENTKARKAPQRKWRGE